VKQVYVKEDQGIISINLMSDNNYCFILKDVSQRAAPPVNQVYDKEEHISHSTNN
jgi:hypothetical protein